MAITHEKGIKEFDELHKNPDAPMQEKTPPTQPVKEDDKKSGNENNVPDPEGPHPPLYS